MMPGIDPRKERVKKRARIGICITMGAMTVLLLTRPGWTWVTPVFVIAFSVISPIAKTGNLPGGRGRGGRGRGSGLTGHGRDDDGPAGAAAHRWHVLVMVSRLMPAPRAAVGWRRRRACCRRSRPPGAARRSAATCSPRPGW
jgi:hypothetical protein